MEQLKVFVLTLGEKSEGCQVQGIYATREKAEMRGMELARERSRRVVLPPFFPEGGYLEISPVDYISIEEWVVE